MKFLLAVFRDPFFWLALLCVALPSIFQLYWGVEGRVVVASPLMRDETFKQTVLYMDKHSLDGAIGVVLNRPYGSKNTPESLQGYQGKVFWGGPVQEGAVVLVLYFTEGKRPLLETLDAWKVKEPDILERAAKQPDKYKVFIGYCVWQALQFENERMAKGWVVGGMKLDKIFMLLSVTQQGEVWRKALEDSNFYKKPLLGRRAGA